MGFRNTALLSRENALCHHQSVDTGHYRMHIPCTASACFALIHQAMFPLHGSHCVVLGRGRLVGAPIADLLAGPGCATVTQCHIHTRNLEGEVARADVLVSGVGHPGLVRGEWIKPGSLVLDCGYSVVPIVVFPSDEQILSALQQIKDIGRLQAIPWSNRIRELPRYSIIMRLRLTVICR
ncbi:unnamed protein product [Echinostoma caproni]|uniref:methenyltetrahydrofolate cyclohydrolase n=1 Tax=Echinostoma caproni TaxID=27848 RepID=A0A3P8L7M7_9TREM|nr:unnamed protein product [Echinostoma caproni]